MNTEVRKTNRQAVFLFGEDGPATPTVLGGKGAGLSEMVRIGVPVPAGFTVTTTVARAHMEHGRLPRRLSSQIDRGISSLERQTGKRFGAVDGNPLLVSVRSGGATSMPGMMDTVLNLGLNTEIVEAMASQGSAEFVWETYRRFLAMYGEVVRGVDARFFEASCYDQERIAYLRANAQRFREAHLVNTHMATCDRYLEEIRYRSGKPMADDPREQLIEAICAVFGSWNNDRAKLYRETQGIDHLSGTAVNVQTMVFGNRDDDSATGVVFSRNTNTGEPGLWGEFLVRAQGEDVVSGKTTPRPIAEMQTWNEQVYSDLCERVQALEDHYGHVVDVEFTIEQGQLYILQVRKAKCTGVGKVTMAVHDVWAKRVSKLEALGRFEKADIDRLFLPTFDRKKLKQGGYSIFGRGISASAGTAIGYVVKSSARAIELSNRGYDVILVCNDTTPEDLPGMLAAKAIVTKNGGATCHAAVVARGLGKPAIVGCDLHHVYEESKVSVDADEGIVYRGEVPSTAPESRKETNLLLRWARNLEFFGAAPRLTFADMGVRVNGNTLLNDFYLIESLATTLSGTKFATQATVMRDKIHVRTAELIATYIVVAVAGELRHFRNVYQESASRKPSIQIMRTLKERFGVRYDEPGISDTSMRLPVQTEVAAKLRKLDIDQQREFMELAAQVFTIGSWSSGYGGHKWAAIAKSVTMFLSGVLVHTVFADHAFDLEHNNGSVFGKHTMILAERGILKAQLEEKKNAATTRSLFDSLRYYHSGVSDDVRGLFDQAMKLG